MQEIRIRPGPRHGLCAQDLLPAPPRHCPQLLQFVGCRPVAFCRCVVLAANYRSALSTAGPLHGASTVADDVKVTVGASAGRHGGVHDSLVLWLRT